MPTLPPDGYCATLQDAVRAHLTAYDLPHGTWRSTVARSRRMSDTFAWLAEVVDEDVIGDCDAPCCAVPRESD